MDKVQTWKYSVDTRQHGFFLAKKIRTSMLGETQQTPAEESGDQSRAPTTPGPADLGFIWAVGSLSSFEAGFFDGIEPADRYVCFADPSTYPNNPGWMLRNLLVLVKQRFKIDTVQILCYRDTHPRREHPSSIILNMRQAQASDSDKVRGSHDASKDTAAPSTEQAEGSPADTLSHSRHPPRPKITGWERNEQNKIVSRTVDLAAYMDPSRLADQAVDLNLKLIKWRIAPSINLDIIKETSCLLLGAGTLGSYVARNLMGWGARKITFVDNARVSFSNPVRQPLYDFKDCLEGGAQKAHRAAEALQEIYPGVDSTGHVMSVPMAGHPIVDETKSKQDYDKLHELIESHDAVFLLMDTRESRWLPTVMAKSAGKIVINAALGFDTYMVMRHGIRLSISEKPTLHEGAEGTTMTHPADRKASTQKASGEEELGCYFCSDVVAPADSLKSATLDQQCTVTRPGVAPLASALAVELLVSVLQSPLRARASAPTPVPGARVTDFARPGEDDGAEPAHPLGTIPHQIRGFLSNWQNLVVKGPAYDCCSACSPNILGLYEREGWEFVKRAISEKGYVEQVSGLAEVQRRAEEAEAEVEWDESEGEEII